MRADVQQITIPPTLHGIDVRLSGHEQVCAERYRHINDRISRLESIIIGCTGVLIAALAGACWFFATHWHP